MSLSTVKAEQGTGKRSYFFSVLLERAKDGQVEPTDAVPIV